MKFHGVRWLLLLIISASAVWAQPLVNVETVLVGDTNNAPHSSSVGSVAYPFRIGKYEVTIGQYSAFLNSVAANDPSGLYNTNMASDLKIAGIARSGSPGSYSYSPTGPNRATNTSASSPSNRPIAYVSWFDAARFCNWLHNGATNGASTEDGAYTLNGATNGVVGKNPSARWWIPTADEWVKAGYYKAGSTNAGYWLYPTQSDEVPGNNNLSGTNRANFRITNNYSSGQPVYTVTGGSLTYPDQNYLTDVGAMDSPSSYGTYDQGGNLYEFTSSTSSFYESGLIAGGGAWLNVAVTLQIESLTPQPATQETADRGFRVAAALPPAPTLTVEQPLGSVLVNDATTNSFGGALTNSTTAALTYTIRNAGAAALNTIAVTLTGANTNQFVLTPPATQQLAPDAATTFVVAFRPQTSGNKTAQVSITSNDTNNNPFIVNLQGYGLATSGDFDNDGLNDAAEFSMRDLGFNWQLAQPALVSALFNNAQQAGLYTPNNVTANPSAFGLFTQSQFNANRTNGRTDVTSNPAAYSLVRATDVPTIRFATKRGNSFSLFLPGSWTRYAQSGMPRGWTFDAKSGVLRGVMPQSGMPSVRLTPYRGSSPGAQVAVQFQPTAK